MRERRGTSGGARGSGGENVALATHRQHWQLQAGALRFGTQTTHQHVNAAQFEAARAVRQEEFGQHLAADRASRRVHQRHQKGPFLGAQV